MADLAEPLSDAGSSIPIWVWAVTDPPNRRVGHPPVKLRFSDSRVTECRLMQGFVL